MLRTEISLKQNQSFVEIDVFFRDERSASLNRSRSCCVGIRFLRGQLLALIGNVMFEPVSWSSFRPAFGCWSSHLIISTSDNDNRT